VLGGELGLDLVVLDDAALAGVDQEHLPGLQAALAHDLVGGMSSTPTSLASTTRPSTVCHQRPGAGRCGRGPRRSACRR
jgi:hypothetical protein